MELLLNTCILRKFSLKDAQSLAQQANNKNIADYLRDIFPHPYTTKDAYFYIEHAANDLRNLILAIDVDGKAVGSIGIHPQTDVYRKNAELGYWLGEQYWGRGIVTEAVKAITEYGFKNYSLHRIYADVFENNAGSARVLEKAGFTREAVHRKAVIKNGVIMDEYVYAKVLI
ncbi:MAG TPA: GNAT family protein [Bacteroidales bacterium]|nr:GNAT family protein [Bacteroidales bacterium]